MRRLLGEGRNDGGGRGARSDHEDPLARIIDRRIPELRVDEAALIVGNARPVGNVGLLMIIISLAHPEEPGREDDDRAVLRTHGLDCPAIVGARPAARRDAVPIMDMDADLVLVDHLAHIFEDFRATRNRRADPGLEAVSESIKIRVRADAGIFVRFPRTAEGRLGLEDRIALARTLLLEMISRSDAGNSGTHNQHIDMKRLGPIRGAGSLSLSSHRPPSPNCGPVRLTAAKRPALISIKTSNGGTFRRSSLAEKHEPDGSQHRKDKEYDPEADSRRPFALAFERIVEIGCHRQRPRRAIVRAATNPAVRNGTIAAAIFSVGECDARRIFLRIRRGTPIFASDLSTFGISISASSIVWKHRMGAQGDSRYT